MNTNFADHELFIPAAATPARRRTVLALAALAMAGAIAGFASGAQANSFTDGNFSGFNGSPLGCTNQNPSTNNQLVTGTNNLPGWNVNSTYTFVLNTTDYTNFSNVTNGSFGNGGPGGGPSGSCIGLQTPRSGQPSISPVPGGNANFLGIDPAYQNNLDGHGWSISQSLTGLILNATYSITFDMAAGQQRGFVGPSTDTWQVGLGGSAGSGSSVTSNTIALPDGCDNTAPFTNGCGGGFSGWVGQTINLVATATNEVLWFFAQSTAASGQPPFLLLDNVTMTQTVPEPPAIGVLLVGLLALLGVRRVYRRKV